MKKKQYQAIAVILALGMSVTACGNKTKDANVNADAVSAETDSAGTGVKPGGTDTGTTIDVSGLFSNRDLSGEYGECDSITLSDAGCTTDSRNVAIDGNTVTITGEGDYIISGTLRDGMIIVDVDKTEKVQLVLGGADITSQTSAAIYVKKADKVFVTLADGTENTLANGGTFEAVDENDIDAVIFSKDDLTLNGTGTLTIDAPAGHGIVSKDELVVTDGTYRITAASHGMTGKDSVAVAGGNFDITAGKDAIRSQNADDDTRGFVYIADGTYLLNAGSDGISALNEIRIAGGTIVVEQSKEGLEARIINISGGGIDITSSDDGINATDKRSQTASAEAVSDRNPGAQNRDFADRADADKAYRKPDGAGKEKDFQGGRGGFGGGMGDAQRDAVINISGGVIRVNAEGDGVDSNGSLAVSGGELYVTGPSNSGNGALDYGTDAVISGGIVVAAGQSGMAQNFGADSTQGTILVNTRQQNAAGSDIVLLDSEGRELIAWTMEKGYNSVVVSCPQIRDGGSYTVKTGAISTEVTMDGLVYGGGHDFQNGGKPDFGNGERPEGAAKR